MKSSRAAVVILMLLTVMTLHAGVIMDEKPVPFALAQTSQICVSGIILDEGVKTSYGDYVPPGPYAVKFQGTGRAGEALMIFSTSPACATAVGRTNAIVVEDRKSSTPATGKGASRGFQDVDAGPAVLGAGFSDAMKKIDVSRIGLQKVITVQSLNPAIHFAFRAKLDVAQR
jgi:hypothetical protein